MIYSLRLRLFLTWLTIIVLAVVLVVGFIRWGTTNEFSRYVDRELQREEAIMGTLIEERVQAEGIENVGPFVTEMGQIYGRSITLSDTEGEIIISSLPGTISGTFALPPEVIVEEGFVVNPADFAGPPVTFLVEPGEMVEIVEEEVVLDAMETAVPFSRTITVHSRSDTATITTTPISSEQAFLGSVNRFFWLAAVGAIAFTGLLGLGLSRRILQPVEALTDAARTLATGDLSQRVAVARRDEIGQLAAAFNQMADNLAAQERLRRHLVSDVAHELRTPLGNIRGYLEAVQDGVLDSDTATIDTIHEEALLLSRLIDDLQELSLAEAGQLRLEKQPTDLAVVVRGAVNSVRPLALGKQIALPTELPPALPLALVDGERIGQVLRNLLRNAIIHTSEGGEVVVTAVGTDEAITIQVRDTGEGIAADHLPHIFDRFYRADPARSRASGSAGLGLAVAKVLVELHDGQIGVASEVGVGTVFTLTLPANETVFKKLESGEN